MYSDKMAHLPDDSLPGEFDVIIDGTGAPSVRAYSCSLMLAFVKELYVYVG